MRFDALVGPSYTLASLAAELQICDNFYPEPIESGQGKNRAWLKRTPGTAVFTTLPKSPVRGCFAVSDRVFGLGDRAFFVAGNKFYEVFEDGGVQERGTVTYGYTPASICSNGRQLMIVTGEAGYIFSLGAGALFDPLPLAGPVLMGASAGTYFFAMRKDSRNINVSAPNDGLTWDEAEFGVKQGSDDNVAGIYSDHGELIVGGSKTTEIWTNTGALDFPFEPFSGGFIEQGFGAQFSGARADNGFFWLGGDSRGAAMVWRMAGYRPERVSNFAIETAMQRYPRISDAIGFAYQEDGHTFYCLAFPSANRFWALDLASGMWHSRSWWNSALGQAFRHRSNCHCYVFGKHLVGDFENGKIYQQSQALLDDFGGPIRRTRRAPHICDELGWVRHRSLTLDIQSGVGLSVPDGALGRDPQIMVRYSDDGGNTWSDEIWISAGRIGEYKALAQVRRLGRARDRVYELVVTDPVDWAFVNAYLELEAAPVRGVAVRRG